MGADIFAEIDIEPVQSGTTAAPVSMPIAPRAADPIREKFYEMRRLAAKPPFPKSNSELFYRQAKFMEDFTDDYDGQAAFNMYFPCYQQMGYDYLRTYFTWRTKVRNGKIRDISLSYIFLYIYELLSGIGVSDPADGLCKLMDIRNKFKDRYSVIENYIPKWLKDYHIFYQLPHSFDEFIAEHGLKKFYSLTLLTDTQTEGQLASWNVVSGYDITKSRYYKDGNEDLLSKCFDAVLGEIRGFCAEKGVSFEDMLIYSVSRRSPWRPFKNALFDSRYVQTDREVIISKYERYYCKNGQWTANLPIYYSSQKDFIGFIIKKTEACLRSVTGYKYKLAVEIKPGSKPFRELQRTALRRAELEQIIEKAVTTFYKNLTRVVVTVDSNALDRIREEALETQEQLIVEDENRVPEASEESVPAHPQEDIPLTLSFSDGWKALVKMFTDTEREAILLALSVSDSSPVSIKAFAAEKGIMPEVLVDGINEKASECIGDSIMEITDGAFVYIYDEYRSNMTDCIF